MKNLTLSLLLFFIFIIAGKSISQVNQNLVLRYSGTQNMDDARAMVLDAANNVYVTGRSMSASNGYDIVTIKYNTAGTILWTSVLNGTGNSTDEATDIAYDGTNIYITGVTSRVEATGLDYITIKLNASTGAILWNSVYNGSGNNDDIATKITVKGGKAFVTGKGFYSGPTNADYVTIKYNASTGDSLWVKNYNGTGNGNDSATCIKVNNPDTSIYITGKSLGTSNYDFTTVKYNASGVQSWVKRYNGTGNGDDIGKSIAMNETTAGSDIYVTGESAGTGSGSDIVTINYTAASVESWNKRINGTGNGDDSPSEIVYRSNTEIYVAGKIFEAGEGANMILLKYNNLGDTAWTRSYNGSANGNDEASGVIFDASAYVYITGKSNETSTGDDYTVFKFSTLGATEWKYSYNNSGSGTDVPVKIAVDATSDRNVYATGSSFSGTTGTNYATLKLKQDKVLALNVFVQGFYKSATNSCLPDSIKVHLYNSAATTIVDSAIAYTDTLGKARFYFRNVLNSTAYRIVIKHRNSIETWGSSTNAFTNLFLTYDFTTAASKAYGNNQKQVDTSPIEYAIYGGDVNQDGTVDATDLSLIDNDASNFITGYVNTDLDGNYFIDASDASVADNNASAFIGIIRP